MYFDIINGAIVCLPCLTGCMFTTESEIASVCLLGELGEVLILLIKLTLGVIILILFIIVPHRHSYLF